MSFGGSNNIRSSPKGASASAPITSTAQGSNNQAVDVQVWHQGAAVNPARALTASDVVTSNQGGTWTVGVSGTVAVTGTFWQATQPVSAAALPLPSGAATEATLGGVLTTSAFQARVNTLGAKTSANSTPVVLASDQAAIPVTGTFWQATQAVSGTVAVTGTFWQATQPVSAAALPLPSGAATEATAATLLTTSAFQARVNTLGAKTSANSTPVVLASDQAALAVTGTFWQATQPISGSVTANIGTSGSLALDATLTGGTQKAIARGAAKGSTAAGDVTSTAFDANTQALDVRVRYMASVRCILLFHSTAPATGDTLLTITRNLGGTVTTGTSMGVTAGKRLVITGGHFSVKSGAAAAAFATMTLRSNAAGATILASPAIFRADVGNTAAASGAVEAVPIYFGSGDGGLEFSGTDTLGISLSAQAITNIISITLFGYEYTP